MGSCVGCHRNSAVRESSDHGGLRDLVLRRHRSGAAAPVAPADGSRDVERQVGLAYAREGRAALESLVPAARSVSQATFRAISATALSIPSREVSTASS